MLNAAEQNEIRRLIAEFSVGRIPDPGKERDAAVQTQTLPAFEDWSAFGAITPNGDIVWVDRDPPYPTRPIEDPRIQRFVLFEASKRYPTLASLCPKRPQDARNCVACGGTGRFSFGVKVGRNTDDDSAFSIRKLEEGIRCFCGGLGWLPANELHAKEAIHTPSSVVFAIRGMVMIIGCELLMTALALAATLPGDEVMTLLGSMAAAIVVSGLTLLGLIARSRLIWQWARLLGMIGGTILLLSSIAVIATRPDSVPLMLIFSVSLVVSTCLWAVAIALGTPSAKTHFNLRCPSCGRFSETPADFLFQEAKCQRCGAVW